MDFIMEWGYDIKRGRMEEFQEWLSANEKEYAQSLPEGCAYLGTFVTVHTSEKNAGTVRTLVRLDSYGAQDRIAAAGKEGGMFAKLARESTAFIDEDGGWSTVLMKAVVSATIWD
ncbi:MAG: hypothetical protein HKN07_04775 [Acidimicrobiia bacterium]|nr:hypothetical protein [Acidimicrobiia bacterium]NNF63554.1 hypothetical protein [Acidimicrobiia bacterium]